MTRSHAIGITLGALAALQLVAEPVSAGILIELEMGYRSVAADWGNLDWGPITAQGRILGPGFAAGGTLGLKLSPQFALTAHADLGLHSASEDLSLSYLGETVSGKFVDSGASMVLLLGGRAYPFGADERALLQPYVGLGLGFGSIAWEYSGEIAGMMGAETDGVGALLVSMEAGGDIRLGKSVGMGVGGRYILNQWAEESVRGIDTSALKGASFNPQAHLVLHF